LVAVCVAAPNGLYGIDANVNLVRINPTNARTTVVGTIQHELQAEQVSALDNMRGLMFLMGMNSTNNDVNLIGVNLTNAKIELNVDMPFVAEGFVGVGTSITVDEVNGLVYALGPISSSEWHLLSVDIKTLAVETIYTFTKNDIAVIGVASVFCPKQGFVWVPFGLQSGGIDLYAIDVKTKSVVKYLPDQDNAGPLSYNKKMDYVSGLGVAISQNGSQTKFQRYLVTMDCATGVFTKGKNVTSTYVIVNDDLFAINYLAQVGYAYLAKYTSGKLGQMRLVGVDLRHGHILVNPPPATVDQIWSLHYYTAGK
jgi:hypothetical protein